MIDEIVYDVPDSTTSTFLVVADRPPDGGGDPARDGVHVATGVWRAEDSPFDPHQVWAYVNWDQLLPPPSAYHLMVSAAAPVRRQPRSAQVARAYARLLAAKTEGVLIDWATRDIVLTATRPERARFHLGDQWLGFDLHVFDDRHTGVPEHGQQNQPARPEDACAAIRIKTRGLARFGVPELVINDVDCTHHLTALNVLRALAQHLLAEHWGWLGARAAEPTPQAARRTTVRQHVGASAFAAYWGASLPGDAPFTVSLAASKGLLRVDAPHAMPLNDWLAGTHSNLRSVAACPPDDFTTYAQIQLSPT
jgi:hypothetical protein